MAQLRILAIEDDTVHASRLEMYLEELGYQLVDIVNNATDALRLFKATKPDLVLMDIGLKGETDDGIAISEKLKDISPVPIIFTTSFSDKATIDRAKSTDPYAYMVKPIEKASLQASIELAVFRFAKDFMKDAKEETQITSISQGLISNNCFFVKTGNGLEKIRYDEVLWLAVTTDRYCEIVTEDKRFTLRTSLKYLEEKLPSHQFIRTFRTHIVNIEKVDNINEHDMTLGIGKHRIPMGQVSRQLIMEKLNIL